MSHTSLSDNTAGQKVSSNYSEGSYLQQQGGRLPVWFGLL